ncbi:MAG: DHH family phosphoesterase [Chloroflexi bacterium]|nr:DHH family phosphoesterase [Chloroflexota bacterium]
MSVDLTPWLDTVPDAAAGRLLAARRILAVCHENPDADTLGAALGVAEIVRATGGRTDVVCSDPAPPVYEFMPGIERVQADPDTSADYDLLVVLDCGTLDRVGAVRDRHRALFARLPHLIVDHHVSNDASGDFDWVDPSAAATCEMVALLAARLGVPLSSGNGALATNLMAGIVMDTATFAHPNATPRTLSVAAALVAAGAPMADISRRLYRTKPESQLRLYGLVLGRLESVADGRIVHSTLLLDDLRASGAIPAYGEGIIDLLAQNEVADIAILFKESDSDTTRISVRTRDGGPDATVLTGAFGGGGHARAAGATVESPLAEARTKVIAEAQRQLASAAS